MVPQSISGCSHQHFVKHHSHISLTGWVESPCEEQRWPQGQEQEWGQGGQEWQWGEGQVSIVSSTNKVMSPQGEIEDSWEEEEEKPKLQVGNKFNNWLIVLFIQVDVEGLEGQKQGRQEGEKWREEKEQERGQEEEVQELNWSTNWNLAALFVTLRKPLWFVSVQCRIKVFLSNKFIQNHSRKFLLFMFSDVWLELNVPAQ